MRAKRENYEISDEEYIEWKLNFKLKNELNWIMAKNGHFYGIINMIVGESYECYG